jgi:tRNA (cmo5U34)-methyltransferase
MDETSSAKPKDEIFLETTQRASDFEFSAAVAGVFDDMVERSVPLYLEQQAMVQGLARAFWPPATEVYDLGCATATTLIGLCQQLPSEAHLTGYDNSAPMLDRAQGKIAGLGLESHIDVRAADLNGDLSAVSLENAGVVLLCWTLQFIRPLQRDNLVRWIYEHLAEGGALIVSEKVLTNNSHMNRFFVDQYYKFKRRSGYSETEILRKREALENVLIPYRIDENYDLFRRNGFQLVETFFQWFNFAGFLCVKNGARR